MASVVKAVSDLAARAILTPARVGDVTEHPGFRTIELVSDKFARVTWTPGDKIRVRVDDLALRTYTPTSWSGDTGTTRILAYLHGDAPGAEWCRRARPGDPCQVLGPDHSVRLDRIATAPIFVGDESSFGLLLAWNTLHPDQPPRATLFEASDVQSAHATLADHGVHATAIVEPAALADLVVSAVRADPSTPLCLTGRAQTIAAVRRRLKADGLTTAATTAKAYWDENRKGLD